MSNSMCIDPVIGPSQSWCPFCGKNLISYRWTPLHSWAFILKVRLGSGMGAFGGSVSIKCCLYCCSIVLILISTVRGHLIGLVVNATHNLYGEGGAFYHHNVPQSHWVEWHRNVINQSINKIICRDFYRSWEKASKISLSDGRASSVL